MNSHKSRFFSSVLFLLALLVSACSPTKHVPAGSYLLDRVKIETDNKDVKPEDLKSYLRQEPNHRSLWIFRFPLGVYNMSGNDTTKWYNRWLRRAGTPPVIYDESLMRLSQEQIRKALSNKGYMDAHVTADTLTKKKRMKVSYHVETHEPHYLTSISYNIPNDTLYRIILGDSAASMLKPGILFDRNILDKERQRIFELLRNKGYFGFSKEYVTYTADTAQNSKEVDLTLNLMPALQATPENGTINRSHKPYRMRNIYFITNYDPVNSSLNGTADITDTIGYKSFYILYGKKKYIRKETLVENCFLRPGQLFSNRDLNNTYTAFGRLGIIKYVNIKFQPVETDEAEDKLDCYILLTEGKSQTVSAELEGTNSEGDLGFAVGATYQHRNIFHGSETFSTKLRASYESLSGDLSKLINEHYTEFGGEIGVTYPKFLFPFIRTDFRRRMKGTTEFSTSLNFQQRPEYTRVIAGAAWKYKWSTHNIYRHNLDLIDISYVYLPKTTDGFLDEIAPQNPLLRYSYENHFIMRMGYTFYRSNININSSVRRTNYYTLRAAGEIAGNVLYGISKMIAQKPNENGQYEVFGINYSQYAKADLDYSYTHLFDTRNSLALHVGFGLAYPYGNASILPFEKRYYSGGANSVRGWSVRTLGPGKFNGGNSVSNFINQCGDIRLDLNMEYRSKLFWKFELAAFVDAGNIWTVKDYESQPGGQFNVKTFYKEIALGYGLGLRLDFNYFLLRFDLGLRAYDPAENSKHWINAFKDFQRNSTLHFAVGYPF